MWYEFSGQKNGICQWAQLPLAVSDVYRHGPWHAHPFFPSLPRWMCARQCALMVMIQHMSWAGEDLRRRGHQSHVLVERGGRQALDLWIILQCQPRGVPICALLSFPLQRWQMHHRKWKYWELPGHLSGVVLDGVGWGCFRWGDCVWQDERSSVTNNIVYRWKLRCFFFDT